MNFLKKETQHLEWELKEGLITEEEFEYELLHLKEMARAQKEERERWKEDDEY